MAEKQVIQRERVEASTYEHACNCSYFFKVQNRGLPNIEELHMKIKRTVANFCVQLYRIWKSRNSSVGMAAG
jgi:hypothetical protein